MSNTPEPLVEYWLLFTVKGNRNLLREEIVNVALEELIKSANYFHIRINEWCWDYNYIFVQCFEQLRSGGQSGAMALVNAFTKMCSKVIKKRFPDIKETLEKRELFWCKAVPMRMSRLTGDEIQNLITGEGLAQY